MKLILGLGNPGPKYALTPHNAGFQTLDEIRSSLSETEKERGNYKYFETRIGDEKTLFVKPQTYMNLSGEVFANFKSEKISLLVVVLDNIDLALGKLRFHYQGGSAGHNGLKSILSYSPVGNDFYRLYVGTGRNIVGDLDMAAIDAVLSHFDKDKEKIFLDSCKDAGRILLSFLQDGDVEKSKRACSEHSAKE